MARIVYVQVAGFNHCTDRLSAMRLISLGARVIREAGDITPPAEATNASALRIIGMRLSSPGKEIE